MTRRRIWDISIFAALLLVGVAVVRSWQKPDQNPEIGSGMAGEVDLLRLIDLEKDRVLGDWAREGRSVLTSEVPFGRLQIPYVPPEEYSITVEVKRRAGIDSFNFGLVGGGRQFVVILDGMKDGDTAGIDMIDGKGFMENPTTFHGKLLPKEQTRTVVYTVTRDRLMVSVDDEPIIDWAADFAQASAYHEWSVPRKDTLFVGSYASRYQIDRMMLKPLRGEGRALR